MTAPARAQRRLVDLSHDIFDGMVTYPGLPAPQLRVHTSRADSALALGTGHSFEITGIDMVANTGTYVDTPSHYFADGPDLAGTALERLVDLPGLVIRAADMAIIQAESFADYEIAGRAVLFDTGWSARFGLPEYGHDDAPYLSAVAVLALIEGGATLVGIDSVNIDSRADPERPAHVGLLRAGIPIVEHLTNLSSLPETGFRFTAAPPKVSGMATFPVRAFAIVEGHDAASSESHA